MVRSFAILMMLAALVLPVVAQGPPPPVTDTVAFTFPPSTDACVFSPGPGVFSGTTLYGTTPGDTGICATASGRGAIWSWVPSTSTFTVLASMGTAATPLDHPSGPIWKDDSNNIFGTSQGSGASGEACGTVWKLPYDGTTKTYDLPIAILYQFTIGGALGCNPMGGVVIDSVGNIYGTTANGGTTGGTCGSTGCGLVFELKKAGTSYTYSILYQFAGSDGANPQSVLTQDSYADFSNLTQLHLFGTTKAGGVNNLGTVFEIEAAGTNNPQSFKSLYSFAGGVSDGANPTGALYFNLNGFALIGTTTLGGAHNQGTIFELTAPSNIETLLHSFQCVSTDVCTPQGTVISDANGNLYGTGVSGGSANDGGTFLMTLNSDGSYTEILLSSMTGNPDGINPTASLAITGTTLYGTTANGGANNCDGHGCGVIFHQAEYRMINAIKYVWTFPRYVWRQDFLGGRISVGTAWEVAGIVNGGVER